MARKRKKDGGPSELVRRDGALALTFVNTGSRRSPRLRDYADLLWWSTQHGGVTAAESSRLEAAAAERPEDAAAGFAAAEEWHALLKHILNARADHKAPSAAALRKLNALAARTVPGRVLAPGRGRPVWIWPDDPEREVYRPLWPIALSATTILTSDDYDLVKRCDAKDCDVLFLAKGRGPPRRWCSQQSCGSPSRSRRYYVRVTKPAIRESEQSRRHESGR